MWSIKGFFLPAYTYRPNICSGSFGISGNIWWSFKFFKMGMIGSTDNHKARAGAGYKEFARKSMEIHGVLKTI